MSITTNRSTFLKKNICNSCIYGVRKQERKKIVLDICLSCSTRSYECYIGVGHRS